MTDELVRSRIDELEALVNGLVIYIAAKEAGLALLPEHPDTQAFIRQHLYRDRTTRLNRSGAEDGYMEAAAIARIQAVLRAIKGA